mgnify:CR=1 FL=1
MKRPLSTLAGGILVILSAFAAALFIADVALRWFVEGPTMHIIDGKGKVRALGLHVGTADARAQLANVIAAAR